MNTYLWAAFWFFIPTLAFNLAARAAADADDMQMAWILTGIAAVCLLVQITCLVLGIRQSWL